MLIKYLLATMLLFGIADRSANASDGNKLLDQCNKAINQMDRTVDTVSQSDLADAHFCFGKMQGADDMNTLNRALDIKRALYCPPVTLTPGQIVRIVVKYIKEHPEDLHKVDIILIAAALREVYPCT